MRVDISCRSQQSRPAAGALWSTVCGRVACPCPAGTWWPLRLKNMHLAVHLWRLFSRSKATSINVFLMPALGPS